MKLLLDANISWRLVKKLESLYPHTVHVDSLDLAKPPPDRAIWDYALKNGYTIVTNDEDFNKLSQGHGFLPKVILLKTGNQSTEYIAGLLLNQINEISDFIASHEYGLLEIY